MSRLNILTKLTGVQYPTTSYANEDLSNFSEKTIEIEKMNDSQFEDFCKEIKANYQNWVSSFAEGN